MFCFDDYGAVQKLYHASEGGEGLSRGRENKGIQLFFLWEKVSKWREMGGGVSGKVKNRENVK